MSKRVSLKTKRLLIFGLGGAKIVSKVTNIAETPCKIWIGAAERESKVTNIKETPSNIWDGGCKIISKVTNIKEMPYYIWGGGLQNSIESDEY